MEEFQTEIVNKKELGQFFSGHAVASLLLNLSKSGDAKRVIDPMCGTGDMLLAFATAGHQASDLTGIEIDKAVQTRAVRQLQGYANVHLVHANAFSMEALLELSSSGAYDLVITNPPYIRRQTAYDSGHGFPGILNMSEIRENLNNFIKVIQTIDDQEKEVFARLVKHFSGLADLAVPAWILCSLIVRKGGKIAMVLPEAWLSRDYALIVKYILLRFFKLEYIIEDANSTWFKTAQVKTILLVAERIDTRANLSAWQEEMFSYVTLHAEAASGEGLVNNIFPGCIEPEKEFIRAIDNGMSEEGLFETRKILLKDLSEGLADQAADQKWFRLVEPAELAKKASRPVIKGESNLRHWYNDSKVEFCKLQDLGVIAGQGLRTGANSFFYLDFEDLGSDVIRVFPDSSFKLPPFEVDKMYFKEVVRKQAELDAGFSLSQFQPKGVVLSLQSYLLPEDISFAMKCNKAFEQLYSAVPDGLGAYIRIAATTRNRNEPDSQFIPDLSAVSPNIKRWDEKRPLDAPRSWYMLPAFSKRHFPDLFLPRVNSGDVKTRMNNENKYLIDANFSSIWIQDSSSPYNKYALLAVLNSTYAVAAMEEYGTVMGGGALKLEATQLKRIPFPVLEKAVIDRLAIAGRKLSSARNEVKNILDEIDYIFLSGLGFESDMTDKVNQLESIKRQLLRKRAAI